MTLTRRLQRAERTRTQRALAQFRAAEAALCASPLITAVLDLYARNDALWAAWQEHLASQPVAEQDALAQLADLLLVLLDPDAQPAEIESAAARHASAIGLPSTTPAFVVIAAITKVYTSAVEKAQDVRNARLVFLIPDGVELERVEVRDGA